MNDKIIQISVIYNYLKCFPYIYVPYDGPLDPPSSGNSLRVEIPLISQI